MKLWKYIFTSLLLILSLAIMALFQIPDGNLHVISCNVGEGDATLLIYKNNQILIDGGPDAKVMNCLGKYLPFWDRELELVILTHPDGDHFTGLINVLRAYKVDNFLFNPITVSKPEYKVLENLLASKHPSFLYPHPGMVIGLDMIRLDIVAPPEQLTNGDSQFSNEKEVPDADTNSYSIVNLVSFGKFKGIFTGDMTPETSDSLAGNWTYGPVNYIKVPHHGSKNGITENFLKILTPGLATVSVGKNNYGHPNQETLDLLKKYNVRTLRTDQAGDIEVITDGEKYWTD